MWGNELHGGALHSQNAGKKIKIDIMMFKKNEHLLVVPRYLSACCPGRNAWLMLCAAFRTFHFCPHANEPRVGIRACFSHAEKTESGQTDLTHPCCGDEKNRALLDL